MVHIICADWYFNCTHQTHVTCICSELDLRIHAIIQITADYSLADEVCHEPCGCFSDDAPFDDRPLPEHYDTQSLNYLLYTQADPDTAYEIHWDYIP